MKHIDRYFGGGDPFEGDRKIWLYSLPAGARVTKVAVILTPAKGASNLFEEIINFPVGKDQGDWSATKAKGSGFCDVDFHARRTLVDITGSGGDATGSVVEAELQVDIGGTLVSIAEDGTFFTPDKIKKMVKLNGKYSLPSLTVNKIRLFNDLASLNVQSVTIRSVPTNVSVRLGDKPPFWMRLGELASSQTSPDFAAVLNAFLTDAAVQDGYYQIPFVMHSDTIARLDVQLDIDYVIEESVLPSYLPEITLPYGYSSLPGVHESLLAVRLPRDAKPVSGTGGRVQGTFDSSRVAFGDIGESEEKDTLVVSPECSLACPIQLDRETPVNGIDLPLANTDPGLAGLHLALQEDADGTPSGKILTEAEVKVARPVPGDSAWGSAQLPAEFRFEKNKRYWLVVQSLNGQALWTVEPCGEAAVALQASTNGGFSWRPAATDTGLKPLQARFRLRFAPEQFSIPVKLQIGRRKDAKRVSFAQFSPLGRVEFAMDFAEELGQFLASSEVASPYVKGDLLVNGSFDLPHHTDASRRLFGFDAGGGYPLLSLNSKVELKSVLDLSEEHFITLSACGIGKRIIDCAGRNPARTGPDEIEKAINYAGFNAKINDKTVLNLTGKPILHPWLRAQVPSGWQDSAEEKGQIFRLKMPSISYTDWTDSTLKNPRPERVVVVLVAKIGDNPAVLSQLVPVIGGCAYFLRIHFLSFLQALQYISELINISGEDGKEIKPTSWEVHWLDAKGGLIRVERGVLHEMQDIDGLIPAEAHLVAPPGALQAEIRFIQPPLGLVLLDDVSFAPTSEALSNGSFAQWEAEEGQPEGWTRLGGVLKPPTEKAAGLVLMGKGPDDATLAQRAEVKAEEHLRLSVSARPDAPPADDIEDQPIERRARLELRWMTDGAITGKLIVLPLDGRDFATHSWAGEVPAGINGAEIRLIQPRFLGNLLVESVSLQHSELVPVKLIFLSEAPGELTVSNLKVAYELPEALQPLSLSYAQIISRGQMMATPQPSPERAMVGPASAAPARSPLADLDIFLVNGISDGVAHTLTGMTIPITTISQLSALDPEMKITGLSRERRLILKAAAETIMSIDFQVKPFSSLSNESLDTLLALTPAEVAEQAGQPIGSAAQLQRSLRSLKLLLKSDAFRKLQLSNLMSR
jgi:hypothetical protein